MQRDFVGYGGNPPQIAWPGGAHIAISLCINVEEGSELSPYFGDDSQQPFGTEASARPLGVRSLATETLYEYGARAGGWRLLRLLQQEEVKATFFTCGMALEQNPPFARAITDAGHEVLGHGYRWIAQWQLEPEAERAYIRQAVEAIARTTGQRPLGWFSRSGPSLNTREILKDEGFLYDSEALNDDLPYYLEVKSEPWLVVPYAFDSNDGMTPWLNADDFFGYLKDSFDELYEEGATHPKMLSIGLHTKRSGRPGRAAAVRRFIRYAKSHPRVWFAGRDEIARWWRETYPPVH
jgi:allantoinase